MKNKFFIIFCFISCFSFALYAKAYSEGHKQHKYSHQKKTINNKKNPPQEKKPSDEYGYNSSDKAKCIAQKGVYSQAGLMGRYRCIKQYSDANKICNDKSECQGKCLANNISAPMGGKVTGKCQANDNPFGCYSEIIKNVQQPGLCVD